MNHNAMADLIDEYLEYLGLTGRPNVEDSLERFFSIKGSDLSQSAKQALRLYVAEFGDA